jgi:hypothetical protein
MRVRGYCPPKIWLALLSYLLYSLVDDVYTLEEDGKDECKFISPACDKFRDLDLETIPYTSGIVSSSFTSISNLFDQSKLKQCLKDRYLVFLGDSTVSERILDMAVTLGGVSKNETALDKFVGGEEVGVAWVNGQHHDPKDTSINSSSYYYYNDVVLAYHAWNHRNMTLTLANDRMKIRYRFTGHYLVHNKFLGIGAIAHPSIQGELGYLLGYDQLVASTKTYNRVPNAIIIHSGYHDLWYKDFYIDRLIKTLQTLVMDSLANYVAANLVVIPPIYWQSTPLHTSKYTSVDKLRAIEEEVFKLSEVLPNLVYINTTRVYEYIPDLSVDEEKYTNDFIHFGAVNRHHFRKKLGTISVLMTNYVLTYVCAQDNFVDNLKVSTPVYPATQVAAKRAAVPVQTVLEFRSNWIHFVGKVKTTTGAAVCLLVGKVFPCPSDDALSYFSAMVHDAMRILPNEMLPLFFSVETLPKLSNNSLVRASGERQIYWLVSGEKLPIRHGRVFFNRGWEFDNVVPIDADFLELFRTGREIDN